MKLRAWLVQGRAVLLAVLIVGAVCVSCVADTPVALVGNWVHYEGATSNKPESMELFKDGTGVVDKGTSVTWKVEDKRFVLLSPKMALSCDYKISGNELTLAYDGGNSAIFVRKEKLDEYKRMKEKEAEARVEKMSSSFTDSRNGQKYRAVKIGNLTWMAQNLNYKTGNSWCYGNDDSKCQQYGRLYDWNAAKGACPSGWRLPSREEWNELASVAGGGVAGKKLKSSSGWNENGNGTDEYGFSALPGGLRFSDGSFDNAGNYGFWWAATENGSGRAYSRRMYYDNVSVGEGTGDKEGGFAVRCVRD
jgi:uncharacterized protein (TIGR02145 family)